ncbi:Plug domain-containing protein, partial [Pseudopedobacter sp.]|uniref:Plug domain-containing protein n=1 Tax=Pseudopedobacter sp. TaxID=1936787 RepID=UPI00333F714F
MSFKKTFTIKVMFCLCFTVVKGQTQSVCPKVDTIKTLRLREVFVKDIKSFSQSLSPVPVQILAAGDLQKMNSLSVADAVRYLSGVQLKDYGG